MLTLEFYAKKLGRQMKKAARFPRCGSDFPKSWQELFATRSVMGIVKTIYYRDIGIASAYHRVSLIISVVQIPKLTGA